MTMLAFHNDPKVKDKYVKRLEKHHAQDQIIRGQYWERIGNKWKGCAVGCTIHGERHKSYEDELGIPESIARLEDRIFENLPTVEESRDFAVQFLQVIPVGADLSKVTAEFCAWTMQDILDLPRTEPLPNYVKESIELVLATFKCEVQEGRINREKWLKVKEIARKSRVAAAYAAADAYAAAAYAAAYAAYAAAAAAYAAADAAAAFAAAADAFAAAFAAAARKEFYQRAATKLLSLLSETSVPGDVA